MRSAPAYVCKNRHGVYQVRVLIPVALQPKFTRKSREIRRSLRTHSFRVAARRARRYIFWFDWWFANIMADIERGDDPELTDEEIEELLSQLEDDDGDDPYKDWGLWGTDPSEQPDRSAEALESQRRRRIKFDLELQLRKAVEAQREEEYRAEAIEELAREHGIEPDALMSLIDTHASLPEKVETPRINRIRFPKMVEEHIRSLLEDKGSKSARSKTVETEYAPKLRTFAELIGNRWVHELTTADIDRAKNLIYKLPPKFGELARSEGVSIAELARRDHPETLAPNSVTKYHQRFQVLCRYAKSRRHTELDLTDGIKFENTKKSGTAVVPFDTEDLDRIFSGFLYKGPVPKRIQLHPYQFWLPLLALLTGARLNELCQLRREDVRKDAKTGYWYLDVDDLAEDQSTKTESSRRRIPVHKLLESIGFPEFAHAAERPRVFESGLTYSKKSGWGAKASAWFNRDEVSKDGRQSQGYLVRCGIVKRGPGGRWAKRFHSFRHTFIDLLRQQGVVDEHIAPIVGHEIGTITSGYGNEIPLALKIEALEQLRLPVDLDHVDYGDFKRRAGLG